MPALRVTKGIYKTPGEIVAMVAPGALTAQALHAVRSAIGVGVSTLELDAVAEEAIRSGGGVPNFMKEPGYRHTLCVSVNSEVVHGVPGGRILEAGDLVSVDCGAELGGWNGDAAFSFVLPDSSRPEIVSAREALSAATGRGLWAGIAALATARHLNDIGGHIEDAIAILDENYGIIEDYVGHGIGVAMHEDPPVFNYRVRGRGPRVRPGLVVAIEPMVTAGTIETTTLDDGWTVVTADGADAAHWEHSVAVHSKGIWVLTAEDGGAAGLAPYGVAPARPA